MTADGRIRPVPSAGAEALDLADAAPEELAYHLGAVKRSLYSLLQLYVPVGGEEGR
ncbi:hypothetical protein SAZ11_35160 [Streptomyces sp. FXJ1.4098]|nr:hypothetical protein [Streptomyces sp. FXJ1.4098]